MKFTHINANRTKKVYRGFQNYTAKQPFMLVVFIDGEPELYDWDGTQFAVEELKRYYKESDSQTVTPLRYSEQIA